MSLNIVLTTADDIVAVIDAVNAKGGEASLGFIREFTGIATDSQAVNALEMAINMHMLVSDSVNSTYSILSPLARLLVTATQDDHKAALMRIILEQFEPFETFRTRFAITQNIDIACSQTRAIYSLAGNERDIKSTIISMATYAKVLKRESASTYTFFQGEKNDHLQYINDLLEEKMVDDLLLRNYFGEIVYQSLNFTNIINPLLDAVSKSKSNPLDTRAVILYAGNAFESFLNQYAQNRQISLQGRNGIISKLTAFQGNTISKKHRGIIEFIGQIRNAADHGADSTENNMTWVISREIAIIYPMVVASAIKNILQRDNGIIEV